MAYQMLTLPLSGPDEANSASSSTPSSTTLFPAEGQPSSQWECLQWLEGRGFATSPDVKRCASGGMEAALREAEEWMEGRSGLGGCEAMALDKEG